MAFAISCRHKTVSLSGMDRLKQTRAPLSQCWFGTRLLKYLNQSVQQGLHGSRPPSLKGTSTSRRAPRGGSLWLCYHLDKSRLPILGWSKHVKDDRLRELAIIGLEAERKRIDEELTALRGSDEPAKRRLGRPPGQAKQTAAGVDGRTTRKRRKMSAVKKKALSERMKRIWADRKNNSR